MKTVLKYKLQVTDVQTLSIPCGAEFLSVQAQRDQPCLWVKVDPQEEVLAQVTFLTVGTGEELDLDTARFIGTYQLYNGTVVAHVFVEEKW